MHICWLIIKISIFIMIGISFFYNFFTHVFLWTNLIYLAYKNQQKIDPSFRTLLKSFIIELICTFVSIVLVPLKFLSPISKQSYKNVVLPTTSVLFIHGYLHHQLAWLWFIHKFKKQTGNKFKLFSINISSTFASMATSSKLIKNKIIDIKNQTNFSKLVLIGHSMGGILASYYCEYLAKPNEVDMIIAIGSPFKGTYLANFGIGQSAEEMLPNSNFLKELMSRIKQSTVSYFSIASKIDNCIPLQSALLYENMEANNNFILKDHGHLRLLISPQVIQQVSNWVSSY